MAKNPIIAIQCRHIIYLSFIFPANNQQITMLSPSSNPNNSPKATPKKLSAPPLKQFGAPIQHLYNLVEKNTEQAKLQRLNDFYAQKKSPRRPSQKFGINLEYYSQDLIDIKHNKHTCIGSYSKNRNTLLEGLKQRLKTRFTIQTKKSYSTEKTNIRLKSLIFGRKSQRINKKAKGQTRDDDQKSDTEKQEGMNLKDKIITENNDNTKGKKIVNLCQQTYTQQNREASRDIQIYIKKEVLQESLNSKPEYMVKRHKINHGFIVSGSKITEIIRSELSAVPKIKKKYRNVSVYLPEISQQDQVNQQNAKDFAVSFEVSMGTVPQKKQISKTSCQKFRQRCLPELLVSEHVLGKLQKMLEFYSLVLLSFGCKANYILPEKFQKYNRKQVEFTYYVGNGNNRNLIVELMNRRWWWKEVYQWQEASLVWTQNKVQKIWHKHPKSISKEMQSCQLNQLDSNNKRLQQVQSNKIDRNIDAMKNRWVQHNLNPAFKQIFGQPAKGVQNLQSKCFKVIQLPKILHNHLAGGNILGDKKYLFLLLKMRIVQYQQSDQSELYSFIPQTFNIRAIQSDSMKLFRPKFYSHMHKEHNLWIVKPGQNSNRGRGIFISQSLPQIQQAIIQRSETLGTTIVQKYITNLLLYQGRKFDIRTYLLCIIIDGVTKFYWYEQGYIRTSSQSFNLKQFDNMIHLTNDAVQSQGQHYGRFEKGNKISYAQLQRYLNQNFANKNWTMSNLVKKMKNIARKVSAAVYPLIDLDKRLTGFELFGMDFIVDSNFTPWLLEVNVNPCLQLASPLLQKLIPNMVQNVFRLAIDPLMPPSMFPTREYEYNLFQKMVEWNKFQVILDSLVQRDKEWEEFVRANWPRYSAQQQKELEEEQ